MPKKPQKIEDVGVCFPITEGGKRSTTTTGKAIIAASFGAVDQAVKSSLLSEQDSKWRYGYQKHIAKAVQMMASGAEIANNMAEAGLNAVFNSMVFIRDGKTCPLKEAMDGKTYPGTFYTGVVKGTGQRKDKIMIRAQSGGFIDGEAMMSTISPLVGEGNMEESCKLGVEAVVNNQQWLDLRDYTFVLLGATSEMGPLDFLLDCGATIVAVARGGSSNEGKWRKLLERAQSSAGTLIVPLNKDVPSSDLTLMAANAGADCLSDAPELAKWISEILPNSSSRWNIGCYIYLDGESFVRAAAAMDAIATQVQIRRASLYPRAEKVGLLFIETPSNFHAVPEMCQVQSKKYRNWAPWWQQLLLRVGALKPLKFTNDERLFPLNGKPSVLCNALIAVQGPNYSLAKLIQRWRIIRARSTGHFVSVNVGPATATGSVMHVKKVAMALESCHHFLPQRLFQPDIVKGVLGLLLVRDLRDAKSKANPNVPIVNPLELIADQAWHGGYWSCGFNADSTGVVQYCLSLLKKNLTMLLAVIVVVAYFLVAYVF